MIPVLFEEDAIDYNTNGIGMLADTVRCIVGEEHNGALDAELDYPADGPYAKELKEGRQFLAKPNDIDDPHVFRIYEVEKILDEGIIFVKAMSITNDLAGNLILHAEVEDATPQEAFNEIKKNLIDPTRFNFVSDIETRSSSEWTRINPLQAIAGIQGSLVHYWGGDVKRTNDTVYLYSRRGRDNVVTLRPGKNIDGFNMTVSLKGVVTKVLPFITYTPETIPKYEFVETYDGEYEKRRVPYEGDDRLPPVTVLGNVVISENADKYPVVWYSAVDYSSDEELMDSIHEFIDERRQEAEDSEEIIDNSNFPEELEQFVTDLLNQKAEGYFIYEYPGIDDPKVTIDVDMLQLSDSPEWERYKKLEHIQVTDTITVYVPKFDIHTELNIESVTYNSLSEQVNRITAGSKVNTLFRQITKEYEDKTKKLEDYINNLENGVYNSISKAADGKTKKFTGYTEPDHDISNDGDMWFRKVGDGVTEMYIYDGGSWQPVLSGDIVEGINQEISDTKQIAIDAGEKADKTINDISSALDGTGFTSLEGLLASKIGNDEFSTLYFQESKAIGLVYEVNGVNEAIIMIEEGVPYIRGKNVILDGDTIVKGSFTVTDEMLANDAIINHLKATGIDANDVNIINLNVDSISAGDIELDKGFRITHNGHPVLSVDPNTGKVRIEAPNVATKEDLEEIELTPGPKGDKGDTGPQGQRGDKGDPGQQGIQGPKGSDGTSQYIHIRYSVNANGNPMTTTPSSNSKYIGLANTTSSTAPTGYVSYTWSLIKGEDGPQGQQGIQGPKGNDGQTTYTWVKYADTETGSGMSDSPDGKLYIGLAFNKTTPTESTTASQYTWSLMPQNIEIGGRNLAPDTSDDWEVITHTGSHFSVAKSYNFEEMGLEVGETFTISVIAESLSDTYSLRFRPELYKDNSNRNSSMGPAFSEETLCQMTITIPPDRPFLRVMFNGEPNNDLVPFDYRIKKLKIERGNVRTDWENTIDQLDEKAQIDDLENLAEIVSDISSEVNNKAGMGELEAVIEAYNARIEQDIEDKAQLEEALATLEGRTSLIEILAGDNKLITQFIDTVITESEEGIFIGNESNSTGILIATDRISFMDNGIEVAYISNQTMEITHGIFVESATISGFHFEKLPGTEILAITWVGDE